jgi:hypothetical protein
MGYQSWQAAFAKPMQRLLDLDTPARHVDKKNRSGASS